MLNFGSLHKVISEFFEHLLVLVCLVFDHMMLLLQVFCKRPVVEIKNGKIKGEIMRTPHNRTYYAFRGIPYAKPPLGELRFKVNISSTFEVQYKFI